MIPYTFRIFFQDQLDSELKSHWQAIQSQKLRLQYFQSFEWHRAVSRHLLAEAEIFYIVAFVEQNPVAVFPLQKSTLSIFGRIPVSILQFPSHNHIPLSDCICLEQGYPQLITRLIDFINQDMSKEWVMMKFEDVREDSDLIQILNSEPQLKLLTENNNASAYFKIHDDFDACTAHMSNKFVKNVRRLQNKANREGNIEYRSVSNKNEREDAYRAFLDVESDGWKGAGNTAINCNAELVNFYDELVNIDCPQIHSVINLITIDGNPIAAQLGLKINDELNLLKIGFSEKFKSIGPGNLVLVETINHAIENQLKRISFVTSPAWAENWRSATQTVSSHYVFNKRIYASLLFFLLKLKRKIASNQ